MIIGKGMVSSIYQILEANAAIGGESIKDMQNMTGCKINVSPASGRDVEREIGLVGSRHAIEQAKRAILEKVDAVVSFHRTDVLEQSLMFQAGTTEPGPRPGQSKR